jgi:hypothetical protein
MRYRKLDANGDYVFGHGGQDFLVNTPEAVGQAVETGLRLFLGEYFADTSQGVDYLGGVVGRNTGSLYDQIIKSHVQATFGVLKIVTYSSSLDDQGRLLAIKLSIATIFDGVVTVATQVVVPSGGYGVGPYGSNPGYGE